MSSLDDKPNPPPRSQNLVGAFSAAFAGLFETLHGQRNMKIHWVSALTVMLVGMALPLSLGARTSLVLCVFFVLSMELLNSSLEAIVDLHVQEYAHLARIAKDCAAAMVLMASAGAVILLADILYHQWSLIESSKPAIVRTLSYGLPLIGLTSLILAAPLPRWLHGALGLGGSILLGRLIMLCTDPIFGASALTLFLLALVKPSSRRSCTKAVEGVVPPNGSG